MKDLMCPYCQEMQESDDENNTQDKMYETECVKCGKWFGYVVDWTKHCFERELPCANGEPHKWGPIRAYPEERFRDRVRCEWCGMETTKAQLERENDAN